MTEEVQKLIEKAFSHEWTQISLSRDRQDERDKNILLIL